MDIRIFDSEDEIAEHAATWCAGAINKAIREKNRATIILSSEVSQAPFLSQFSSKHVDWSRVTCFQLCELSGVGRDDPRSFTHVIKEKICDRVCPEFNEYHELVTHGDCHEKYSQLLQTEIDLVCIGMGNDGSIGFIQPDSAEDPDTCLVEVKLNDPLKRQMVEEGRVRSRDQVPERGLTVNLPVLLRARAVSMVVPDFNKTDAVRSALLEKVGMHCPGSLFREHTHGVMWLNYQSARSYLDRIKRKPQYGMVRIPGLVDLQVMGYKGVDYHDITMTEDVFRNSCREILSMGVAVFLPTLITSNMAIYEHNLPIIAKVIQEEEFKIRIPGIHLDGPFISRDESTSSCHHGNNILDPDAGVLDHLLTLCQGKLILMTLAADVPGAIELANYASAQGVKVSLGHQLAGHGDVRRIVRVGAKMLTHFGNGVPEMINRHHNPIWPCLVEDNLMAAIITDGHHLSNDIIKAVLRVKGEDNTMITSDMTSVTGLPPGQYTLFDGVRIVLEANNAVFLENGEWFAGSAMTALQCANYMLKQEIVDIGVIQKLCFHNPLRLLGVDPKPILETVAPMLKVRRGGLEIIDPDDDLF